MSARCFPSSIPLEYASQTGLGQSLRNSDGNNFAPRFGFSYQLDNRARTVLRGGWGVYYNHYSENVTGRPGSGAVRGDHCGHQQHCQRHKRSSRWRTRSSLRARPERFR